MSRNSNRRLPSEQSLPKIVYPLLNTRDVQGASPPKLGYYESRIFGSPFWDTGDAAPKSVRVLAMLLGLGRRR